MVLFITFAAIYDLNAENGKESLADDKKSPWVKPIEIVKEPDICSASRNLLFSFPGRDFLCIVQIFIRFVVDKVC